MSMDLYLHSKNNGISVEKVKSVINELSLENPEIKIEQSTAINLQPNEIAFSITYFDKDKDQVLVSFNPDSETPSIWLNGYFEDEIYIYDVLIQLQKKLGDCSFIFDPQSGVEDAPLEEYESYVSESGLRKNDGRLNPGWGDNKEK